MPSAKIKEQIEIICHIAVIQIIVLHLKSSLRKVENACSFSKAG